MNQYVQSQADALLEIIHAYYTDQRKAELRARLSDAWYGRTPSGRFPYAMYGGKVENKPEIPADAAEEERELLNQLALIAAHTRWGDDFYPALAVGVRQVSVPSYFGCGETHASGSVKVTPIINSPEDVYSIPTKGFIPGTAGCEVMEKIRLWREYTHGTMEFFEPDMQGPFSVASQIWEIEAFLLAVYDNPDECHYLIGRCVDALIAFYEGAKESAGGSLIALHCMPVVWFPIEKGIAVSEDLAAVVSPSIFREFVSPYLERIAERFGGVVMHSCGSLNHVAAELGQVEGLVGVNFSACETDLEGMLKILPPNICVVTHNSPINRPDLTLLSPMEHARRFGELYRKYNRTGVCFLIPFVEDSIQPGKGDLETVEAYLSVGKERSAYCR